METYDMKPDAPIDYRGLLNPIATNAPGIEICELLPLHAKVADRFTLIRSITHEKSQHARGSVRFLSGRKTLSVNPVSEFPTVGPIVSTRITRSLIAAVVQCQSFPTETQSRN